MVVLVSLENLTTRDRRWGPFNKAPQQYSLLAIVTQPERERERTLSQRVDLFDCTKVTESIYKNIKHNFIT